MRRFILIYIVFLQSVSLYLCNEVNVKENRILSRKKRYLVFPEGSSFQLVYCLTIPTYGVGTIFTMGLTAALAWELPHEPIDLKSTKTNTNSPDKRVDEPANINKQTVYKPSITDWSNAGWHTYTTPPKSHFINSFWTPNQLQFNNRQTGSHIQKWDYSPAYRNTYLYKKHGDVHRRTRRELFSKIEKFFQAQNKDGKACLLKAICEVNQTRNSKKGTFMEEILRAIFTWIPEDDDEINVNYNLASNHKGNCTKQYASCSHSVWDSFF